MSSNFGGRPSVTVSGNFGGKVPVADNLTNKKIHRTISFDENCIGPSFYVDLTHTDLTLKLEFVKNRGYETHNITAI